MSGDAYVDIVNMAVEISLQHMTTLTVSPCLLIYFAQADEGKSIYFRSGKSEAAPTHSQSRTRQHRFSSESSNGCPL